MRVMRAYIIKKAHSESLSGTLSTLETVMRKKFHSEHKFNGEFSGNYKTQMLRM